MSAPTGWDKGVGAVRGDGVEGMPLRKTPTPSSITGVVTHVPAP